MNFWFKNTNKDIIMTEEDNQDFENNNICRYCEKYIEIDKVRDHCHLTLNIEGLLIMNVIYRLSKKIVIS